MRSIFLSFFVITAVFAASVSAQSAETRRAFEKGVKLSNAGDYEAALFEFKDSLRLAETDDSSEGFQAKIHFNVGVCLYRAKRNAEAVGALEEAVRLSQGKYEKAFYALGMARAELGDWQAAENAFRRALNLNAKNGEAWFDLAFVYLAQSNSEAAQMAFRKAVAYRSVDAAVAHNNLGVLLAVGGDINAAVKEFETAFKKSGNKLAVAERNLQFCKSLGRGAAADLIAKLEFRK